MKDFCIVRSFIFWLIFVGEFVVVLFFKRAEGMD